MVSCGPTWRLKNARRNTVLINQSGTHFEDRRCVCPSQPNRVRSTRDLISTVHEAITNLGKPARESEGERTPAVPIRRSVHRDYVVCLECGWRGQMLKRHLTTGHGLSVAQYRARWNLPREHPMTAPGYSERRSSLAKQIGLGRGRGRGRRGSDEEPERAAPEEPPAAQPPSRRRGRPRSATTAT
jgi:predicted transcriptional regulator